MEIKSLAHTSFETLAEAFGAAFAEYEVQLDKEELRAMLRRRGFDPALSFAAFDRGKIVSFTCNGIGDHYGTPTAYDTGTGTLEAYRGQGLATQVFEHSIPYLREAGVRQYLLEVLQHNADAVSVYRKIGFETTREFYYFRAAAGAVKNTLRALDFAYEMRPIEIATHPQIATFWDFRPSWQNSMESIGRSPESFVSLGVFTEGQLIGYGVIEPASGDITQIAVAKTHRRQGIGSLLLAKLLEQNRHDAIKIVNTDIECDSMTAFLASKTISPAGRQFEMVKGL